MRGLLLVLPSALFYVHSPYFPFPRQRLLKQRHLLFPALKCIVESARKIGTISGASAPSLQGPSAIGAVLTSTPRSRSPGTSRRYVFTLYDAPHPYFSFGTRHEDWLRDATVCEPFALLEGVKCICYQGEKCPNTGRFHLQGYVVFTAPVRLPGAKKRLRRHDVHFEPVQGTTQQAIDYTRKDETRVLPWVCYGTLPTGQGFRSDLQTIIAMVQEGRSDLDIAMEAPASFIRSHRGIRALRCALNPPKPRHAIHVCCLYGATGVGKSYAVHRGFPNAWWWPRPQNGHPYCLGYNLQRVCVIDDFRDWVPLHLWLQVCDQYPLSVNTQGENSAFLADTIIITSNHHPSEWWPSDSVYTAAVLRRINFCCNMDELTREEAMSFTFPKHGDLVLPKYVPFLVAAPQAIEFVNYPVGPSWPEKDHPRRANGGTVSGLADESPSFETCGRPEGVASHASHGRVRRGASKDNHIFLNVTRGYSITPLCPRDVTFSCKKIQSPLYLWQPAAPIVAPTAGAHTAARHTAHTESRSIVALLHSVDPLRAHSRLRWIS